MCLLKEKLSLLRAGSLKSSSAQPASPLASEIQANFLCMEEGKLSHPQPPKRTELVLGRPFPSLVAILAALS